MNFIPQALPVTMHALSAAFQAGAVPGAVEPTTAVSAGTFFANTEPSASTPDSTASSARRFTDRLLSAGIFTNIPLGFDAGLAPPFNPFGQTVATVASTLIVTGLLAFFGYGFYTHRRDTGYELARKYFGDEYDQVVKKLQTCKKPYRRCASDDVKLLIRSARMVESILALPEDQRTTAIGNLIAQWNFYAPASCYAFFFDAGVPARAIEVLSRMQKDAFTKEQYKTLRAVGADDFIPSFGQRLIDAASNLRSRFEEQAQQPV